MVILNKEEAREVIRVLKKEKSKKLRDIIRKMEKPEVKLRYVYERKEIKALLRKAFKEKKKVKINYYSLSSDSVANRVIDIYQWHEDCIIAFCNLRKDERTFVINRINRAALLNEKYKIPRGWTPESVILN